MKKVRRPTGEYEVHRMDATVKASTEKYWLGEIGRWMRLNNYLEDAQASYSIGCCYIQLIRYEKRVQQAAGAIRTCPQYYLQYASTSSAYYKSGLHEQVVKAYKDIFGIGLNPEDEAYHILGIPFDEKELQTKAIWFFKRAVWINPDLAWAYLRLGELYFCQPNYEDAAKAYEQAVRICPNPTHDHSILAEASKKGVHYDEEWDVNTTYMFGDSSYLSAYYCLGIAYDRLRRYEDSLEAFRKLTRIEPDFHNELELDILFSELTSNRKKIEKCKEAEKIKLLFAESYVSIADALLALGLTSYNSNVRYCLEEAIEIKPDYLVAYDKLGWFYIDLGRFEGAAKLLKKATELNPSYLWTHYNLCRALQKLDDKNALIEECKSLAKLDKGLADEFFKQIMEK